MENPIELEIFYRKLIEELLTEANAEQLKIIHSFLASYLL